MLKKILLMSLLFFSFLNIWFAETQTEMLEEQTRWMDDRASQVDSQNAEFNNTTEANNSKTPSWKDNLMSTDFEIDTGIFSPWGNKSDLKRDTAKDTINTTLWTFIQKAMIFLWILSLFIMIVWAWFMILHHWEDEFLNKWKSIFVWWIIALIVALSSYYIVNIIWFILYSK